MEADSSGPVGLLRSLRSLGDNLLASVEQRLELFSIELQQEKLRLVQTLIWISAAIFAGMLALTFGSLTLVYLFWDSARLAVLAGLTVFYVGTLATIVVVLSRRRSHQPKPFAATLEELGHDRACIQPQN